jgi:hypothetical protein
MVENPTKNYPLNVFVMKVFDKIYEKIEIFS